MRARTHAYASRQPLTRLLPVTCSDNHDGLGSADLDGDHVIDASEARTAMRGARRVQRLSAQRPGSPGEALQAVLAMQRRQMAEIAALREELRQKR